MSGRSLTIDSLLMCCAADAAKAACVDSEVVLTCQAVFQDYENAAGPTIVSLKGSKIG